MESLVLGESLSTQVLEVEEKSVLCPRNPGIPGIYHGYPRATADMDIWIAMHPQNTRKIVIALKEFGFDLAGLTAELFQKEDQIIRMGVPPVRIEIATSISGVTFAECYASQPLSFAA